MVDQQKSPSFSSFAIEPTSTAIPAYSLPLLPSDCFPRILSTMARSERKRGKGNGLRERLTHDDVVWLARVTKYPPSDFSHYCLSQNHHRTRKAKKGAVPMRAILPA